MIFQEILSSMFFDISRDSPFNKEIHSLLKKMEEAVHCLLIILVFALSTER